MKKQLVLTATVALGTGFLAGYFTCYKYLEHKFEIDLEEELGKERAFANKKSSVIEYHSFNSDIQEDRIQRGGLSNIYYQNEKEDGEAASDSGNENFSKEEKTTHLPPKDNSGVVSYHTIARGKVVRPAEQPVHQEEDEEDEEDGEDDEEDPTDDAGYLESDLNYPRDAEGPYLIHRSSYYNSSSELNYDKIALLFFADESILCEENGSIIDDIDATVGWGAFKNLESRDAIYVRNDRLEIDYEIVSIRGSYAKNFHRIDPDAGLTPRERYNKRRKEDLID